MEQPFIKKVTCCWSDNTMLVYKTGSGHLPAPRFYAPEKAFYTIN